MPGEGFLFFLEGWQQHRNQELRFRHVKFEEPLRHPVEMVVMMVLVIIVLLSSIL